MKIYWRHPWSSHKIDLWLNSTSILCVVAFCWTKIDDHEKHLIKKGWTQKLMTTWKLRWPQKQRWPQVGRQPKEEGNSINGDYSWNEYKPKTEDNLKYKVDPTMTRCVPLVVSTLINIFSKMKTTFHIFTLLHLQSFQRRHYESHHATNFAFQHFSGWRWKQFVNSLV